MVQNNEFKVENFVVDDVGYEDIEIEELGDIIDAIDMQESTGNKDDIGEEFTNNDSVGSGRVANTLTESLTELYNSTKETNPTTETISDVLKDVLGSMGDSVQDIDNDEDEQSHTQDWKPIETSESDKQKGIDDLQQNKMMDVDEKWDQNPGRHILAGGRAEGKSNIQTRYPLILIEVTTEIMLNKIKELLRECDSKDKIDIYLKIGEGAEFLSRSSINHIVYNKLIRLGLNPIYYESKGVRKEYKAEDLFDPIIYNPRILIPEDNNDSSEPIENLIPKTVYEETYNEPIPEPVLGSSQLNWEGFKISLDIDDDELSEDEPIEENKPRETKEVDLQWN